MRICLDNFIALPGGIGTLDEISEAITLTKIGVFNKPCIMINKNGFYNPFKNMLDSMEQAGFLRKESLRHVLFSDDIQVIDAFINEFEAGLIIPPKRTLGSLKGKVKASFADDWSLS